MYAYCISVSSQYCMEYKSVKKEKNEKPIIHFKNYKKKNASMYTVYIPSISYGKLNKIDFNFFFIINAIMTAKL